PHDGRWRIPKLPSVEKLHGRPCGRLRNDGRKSERRRGSKMTNSINGRIRKERMKTGLTYRQFANKIGVDPATMNRWENGKTNLRAQSLLLLSKAFGVTTDYLLRGTGEKTFVGVFSFGGIISDVQTFDTLEEGI